MLASLPSSAPRRQHAAAASPQAGTLRVHARGSADRAEVEAFIHAVYSERFGADVRHYAPVLVSLRDTDGRLVAAAGYRAADEGPLFLERYLDRPIDARLSETCPHPVPRHRLVEVGHLAASRAGAGRLVIALLGPHLAAQGFHWVVSTLTQELRHLFLRLGIAPVALGIADPDLLGEDAACWGSYYDHRPVVLAGNLEVALHALARRGEVA